jgi:hypothetical protein
MRLRSGRLLAALQPAVEKFHARLPAFALRFLYAPLPRIFRERSLAEDLEHASHPVGLPASYEIDPRLLVSCPGIASWRRADAGVKILHLADVTVLGDGTIIRQGAIHRSSAVYRRINPSQLLAAAREYHFPKGPRAAMDSATIVSRQIINEGTWGDYFLEFLMPMAWVPARPGRIVLRDSDFVAKHAWRDSGALGIECLNIPAGGLRVRSLEVVGPCQVFNNFEEANIRKMRERFPVKPAAGSAKRLFLSRLGAVSENVKNPRAIANEEEVAAYLGSEGFEILYPHEMDNDAIRSRIAGADVVVGCWGAAMLNLMWGQPKIVIELVSENFWSPTAVKLSLANGVGRHVALRTTDHRISIEELSEALGSRTAGR